MPEFIDNLPTQDKYVPALQLGPAADVAQISFSVLNEPALVQFWKPTRGAASSQGDLEVFERIYVAGSFGVLATGVAGVKFRSAVVGKPAQIVAELTYTSDPKIVGGTVSGVTFNTSGQATGGTGISAVTGDYKVSAQAATHPDGSGGTWYLCDGTAFPAGETALIAMFGAAAPDARGRELVMKGPHAAVAFLANDGLAAASREPFHGHTFSLTAQVTAQGGAGGVNGVQNGNPIGPNGFPVTGSIGVNGALDTEPFLVPGSLFVHS